MEQATQPDGFVENMSYEEYAKVDALNGSKIIHMRRSPMKYKDSLDNPAPPSPAMILGTATHRLILEPDLVGEFAIWGVEENQKIRNGRVWNEFREANEGRFIVTRNECDAMVGMGVGARRNLPIRKYADAAGNTEVSMFWTHPHTGRKFKARLDKVIVEMLADGGEKVVAEHDRFKTVRKPTAKHTIFDLKTTRDCRDFKFSQQAWSLGYIVKMGLYWYGYKTLLGVEPSIKLGAIESKAPHESAVYNVPRDLILLGVEELDKLVERITECEESDAWPASQQDEMDLVMPPWAYAEADTELDLEMV
jgi:hypothetical protein